MESKEKDITFFLEICIMSLNIAACQFVH